MKNKFEIVEKLSESSSIKILFLLMLGGLIIRFYFTPFNLPISLDGIDYFAYAVAMSREGIFPSGYLLTNFGWSSFLSIVFSFFKESEMIELMNIQRTVTIVISLSVLIPTMILFGTWYGIMGVAASFVLATIIQSVYFFITSKKLDKKRV